MAESDVIDPIGEAATRAVGHVAQMAAGLPAPLAQALRLRALAFPAPLAPALIRTAIPAAANRPAASPALSPNPRPVVEEHP